MRKRHRLVLRNLLLHKYQFVALSVIVMLGVAIFVSLTVSFNNMGGSYQRTYTQLRFADFTVRVAAVPSHVLEAVGAIQGVSAAEGRLIIDTGLVLNEVDRVHARLIGLQDDRRPEVNNVLVQSGRYWGTEDRSVALSESRFAAYHGLSAGDRLAFVTPDGHRDMEVIGDAASPEYLINAASRLDLLPSPRRFGVFFVPLREVQSLFGLEGQVNDVAVLVSDPGLREAVIGDVEEMLAPYGIQQTVRREDQPCNAALQLDLEGAEEFANLLPIMILLIAALSIFIAMSRMVQAQRQQIGLFVAIGYSRGSILRHYLTYSVAVALIGSAAGVALGLWLAALLTDVYADTLGIPLVQGRFQLLPIAESVMVSLAVALLAGIGPAWRSARMRPAEAMRLDPQVALVKGGVPWAEKALRLVVTPPMALRIPLRAVFRNRRRSIYTGAGVAFAITLLLAAVANFDTINYMLDVQFNRAELWDIDVNLRPTTDVSALRQVESWPEVRAVEPTLEGFGSLRFQDAATEVAVLAMPAETGLHEFQIRGGKAASFQRGSVVVTPYVARQTGAAVGDRVSLLSPTGVLELTVTGVSEESLGGGVYVVLEDAAELLGATGLYNGMLISASSQVAQELKARLYGLPGVESVNLKSSMLDDWNEIMALFNVMAGVVLVFALVMAFAILFNTVTVNVLERQRELGTMRTLGESRLRLAAMMVVESLLLGLAALGPGAVLGTVVAYYMVQSFSSDLFTMQFHITYASYGVVAVGVLLTVALSAVPAVRRVNRMDLAEVTKVLA